MRTRMKLFVRYMNALFVVALFASTIAGQTDWPKVEAKPYTLADAAAFRGRNFADHTSNKTGAIITSVFLSADDRWILVNASVQKVREGSKLSIHGYGWDSIDSRVFAINRDNGRILQLVINGENKDKFLISGNFTMLSKNVVAITMKKDEPGKPPPAWQKQRVQFLGWNLITKRVKKIDQVTNSSSAALYGILDDKSISIRMEKNHLIAQHLTSDTKIKVHHQVEEPLTNACDYEYYPWWDQYFVIPGYDKNGVVICKNRIPAEDDSWEKSISHISFDPERNWKLDKQQIQSKVLDKTFSNLNEIYPVYGSNQPSATCYFALVPGSGSRRVPSSCKVIEVNTRSGKIKRILATRFDNSLDFEGGTVVSPNGRWLAVMGWWKDRENKPSYMLQGIKVFDLKNGTDKFQEIEDYFHRLNGITNTGQLICTRRHTVSYVFPESDFAERSLFSLWPHRMSAPKK